ncbi:RNA-binding domain-containing protein [Saccharata proteae CBS 121410]|uniref:Multiple RNA-binding domain-containing protein 1 n=1 Tax=Saccharata proteae CBS 121410 TaxID=1314787 RepID=A0A9P4I1U9_9PEZI|nr:RNA-binding domain-containing protein [Saccharata proteae CBS 121410]
MESSRIFVRGLPPTLTEADFRKHFSQNEVVTDAKLMPHRRIGYIGYKTPEAAAKAVKYFNKTFIRMSRIGVELARPVDDEALPQPRRRAPTAKVTSSSEVKDPASTSPSNPLKRKRVLPEPAEADPKLREFLDVMKPPSKTKAWQNDDMQGDQGAVVEADNKVETVPVDEADSDGEYQTVQKKTKRISQAKDSGPSPSVPEPEVLPDRTAETKEPIQPESEADRDADQTTEAQPVSDADWLRSRTSRLLGLVEDDDMPPTKAPVEDSESESDAVPEVQMTEDVEGEDSAEADPVTHDEHQKSRDEADIDRDSDAIHHSRRLFLRNLPYSASEDDIRAHFSPFGTLEEVHLAVDQSGNSKGVAFVLFEEGENAVRAFRSLDGKIFQGRLLHILPGQAKRENKLDEFAISKLPLKKQKEIQRKSEAASTTFNWNSLYMNADAVMSSMSDRLGVSKSELLDPTSSDAAVKQAHAETHIIQETKSYFAQNGVDLDAFKQRARGDTAILVKNFPYGTKTEELRTLFEEHGQITRLLMPPSGTIAIVEFAQAPQARSAFATLAYRKIKDSVLFLEKAPKDLFKTSAAEALVPAARAPDGPAAKLAAGDLLQKDGADAVVDSSTLFVRNLNFTTTTERLTEVFKPLSGFLSARVKTKTDPKKPGETLSMGFGFLEFRTKEQAQAALRAMDGYSLDGHRLLIKASHKGADAAEERRKEDRAKRAAGRQTKIIIKNLPFETTKKDIRALFGAYGQLRSVRVPKKFDTSARGFAFADFTTPREAENAMDALRNTHLLGRKLVLDFASEDAEDAEEEISKMQKKVGKQVNKVALQNLTGAGRKKFNVAGTDELDEA